VTDRLGAFADLYRRTAESRSAIVLVAANSIPLFGVLFLGWSLWTILVIYWVENGIVGFWTIPRILMARGTMLGSLVRMTRLVSPGTNQAQVAAAVEAVEAPTGGTGWQALGAPSGGLSGVVNLGLAAFFVVHYGIFWFVHGIFVFALPAFLGPFATTDQFGLGAPDPIPFFPGGGVAFGSVGPFGEILWSSVAFAAAALFISHGLSFFVNDLRGGEYLRTSAGAQVAAPYKRVVVLHLTILFGAFMVALIGAPIGALVVMVAVKTLYDLGAHLRQHALVAEAPGT
jgi:hypothetical protein